MHGSSTSPSPLRENIKPRKNNQIRAKEVRLISQEGENLGVVSLGEAVSKAKDAGLDLIEITANARPPVCRIGDYGKHLYKLQKKEQKSSKGNKAGELKEVQLTFNISDHDLETRRKRVVKFLKQGYKVRIRMRLRGRENALQDHALKKTKEFMDSVDEQMPIKTEKEVKRRRGGLIGIIQPK